MLKKLVILGFTSMLLFIAGCEPMQNVASTLGMPPAPKTLNKTPTHIALLLPLNSGVSNQAKAIQNGFFSAYFADKQQNHAAPTVNVIDTSKGNIQQIYQTAVKNGADLIVGPLLKEDVSALEEQTDLPVPVLALNIPDINAPRTSNSVFEFSLSPQDEAQQVATRAFQDGKRQAILLAPLGDWGTGIATAFQDQWRALGGHIVTLVAISPNQDLNALVKNLTTTYQNRFDMVMLAVSPSQARQIKPLLTYYNAGNIAVYATSLVYSGRPQATQDADLNGVIFGDMPWVSNSNAEESQHPLPKLYAFGEDAYFLSKNLNNLLTGGMLNGQTGQLYLDKNWRIRRHLVFVIFRDGTPQGLTSGN